jgi:putative transposase
VRPATPLICQFIDEHRGRYGVAPICRALAVHGVQIAPRTYWAHRSAAPSKRVQWDTTITEILAGIYEPKTQGKRPPESLYGSLKMWAYLRRKGIPVARRPDPHAGRPGRHHLHLGPLVQRVPADAPSWPPPAHRSRSQLLRAVHARNHARHQ